MKGFGARFLFGVSRPDSGRLMLLLVLVVLAPSVALLWFMTQAMRNERLAARQELAEAYRAHLSLAQERLQAFWQQVAAHLEAQSDQLPAPALFQRDVQQGLADAVICLSPSNSILYPNLAPVAHAPPASASWSRAEVLEPAAPAAAAEAFGALAAAQTNLDLAAQAYQAQARCLRAAAKPQAALEILLGPLARDELRQSCDPQGRLIVPSAQLMALELMQTCAPAGMPPLLGSLRQRLNDYHDEQLSAPQRRFLMRQVQQLFPREAPFPTLEAEDLAAQFIEPGPVEAGRLELRATALPGVWQFGSTHGRVIGLYRAEPLLARLRAALLSAALPGHLTVEVVPPGKESDKGLFSTVAGPALPGWRLALVVNDRRLLEAAADQRIAAYLWTGVLVVIGMLALGVLALQLVRRQAAQTQLRNDLVANVTHELKTPLASMRLLVDTLLDAEQLHEPTVREYLALVAKENARLSRLIDHFLAFSRMERNKQAFDFVELEPAAILQSAAAAVRERFNTPGCRFTLQPPGVLPAIRADADALVTALVNLLDNAYKYSGDQKQITLSAGARGGRVFFAVEDNGIGIAPRETRRIFKRFYQIDQRLSRSGGGVGLGLSIVKFIVTAHQGSIEVQSRPGQGSRFIIDLPASSL